MRKNYTKEDIIQLVADEDVEFIRLQFTDIFGNLKNMAITASQLERRLIMSACSMVLPSRDLHGSRNPTCICIRI